MESLELIKNRRTIRKFKDQPIPQSILEEILDAGRWAPSAHNLQPWKFIVIKNKSKIKQIADLLDDKANSLLAGFNIVMKDTARNLKNSPLLLAIYSNGMVTKKFERYGSPYKDIGTIYEIQSITTAIENVLLYAHSKNLGSAWNGMVLFCEKEINNILVQSGRLMAILSLGYPDGKPKNSSRRPISEIVEFIK